jgi:hypothetical protein
LYKYEKINMIMTVFQVPGERDGLLDKLYFEIVAW